MLSSIGTSIIVVAAAAAPAQVMVARPVAPESHVHVKVPRGVDVFASNAFQVNIAVTEAPMSLDFGILTESDIEMMQLAANAPADTIDYAALFSDD